MSSSRNSLQVSQSVVSTGVWGVINWGCTVGEVPPNADDNGYYQEDYNCRRTHNYDQHHLDLLLKV